MNTQVTLERDVTPQIPVPSPPRAVAESQAQSNRDLPTISGYKLHNRIGSGGFGEVWRATAPGGLTKAVKIVFGHVGDARADAERKALERIKDVRHPFVLTLERIELVSNRLLIVMELAESSLKERLEACQKQGLSGIPRDELLAYLHDAADALDYMYDEHALAHLDIKPENLLKLGRHVKVADFGLTKDLRDNNMSVLSGVTPLYSAPEVFEGRPCSKSDQYSLAVVYQMLLTGVPPHQGRTAAQLMAQHLRSAPDLTSLPTADRVTIARALSKDPDRRFECCRELIEHLSDRRTQRAVTRKVEEASQQVISTPALGDAAKSRETIRRITNHWFSPTTATPGPTVELPRMTLSPGQPVYRPTVFVGIGGVGCRIIAGVSNRIAERFSLPAGLPTMQYLLIDTDRTALGAIARTLPVERPQDVVDIPLRSSADYRAQSSRLLEWLDRRWLYNVPRSLKPEGIRPLGRLAAVDHAARVHAALDRAIGEATSPNALKTALDKSKQTFAPKAVRVCLVASSAGGTGSGATLDIAQSARTALIERGFRPDDVHVFLLHGTGRMTRDKDLCLASSLACLAEFKRHGVVAPDSSAAPVAPEARPGVANTYFINIGDSLSEAEFEGRLLDTSEYLYRSTVTEFAKATDTLRSSGIQKRLSGTEAYMLSTVAVARYRSSAAHVEDEVVLPVVQGLISHWQGALTDDDKTGLVREIQQQLVAVGLNTGTLQKKLAEIGRRPATTQLMTRLFQALTPGYTASHHDATAVKECFSGIESQVLSPAAGQPDPIRAVVEDGLGPVGHLVQGLRTCATAQLEAPGRRLAHGQAAIMYLASQLGEMLERLAAQKLALRADLSQFRNALFGTTDADTAGAETRVRPGTLEKYVACRVHELVLSKVEDLVNHLLAALRSLANEIGAITATLKRLSTVISAGQQCGGTAPEETAPDLIGHLDQQLLLGMPEDHTFFATLRQHTEPARDVELLQWLAAAGANTLGRLDGDNLPAAQTPAQAIVAAEMQIRDTGGAKCRMLISDGPALPDLGPRQQQVTVLSDPTDGGLAIVETVGLSFGHVARRLIGYKSSLVDVASRLRTQRDGLNLA